MPKMSMLIRGPLNPKKSTGNVKRHSKCKAQLNEVYSPDDKIGGSGWAKKAIVDTSRRVVGTLKMLAETDP